MEFNDRRPKYLYHEAHRNDRESIRSEGLRAQVPHDARDLPRGVYLSPLHAKVLVVDRRDLLITSANLTGHGMKHNLEFGLRVLGRPAADATDHLEGLIRSGEFEPVSWS